MAVEEEKEEVGMTSAAVAAKEEGVGMMLAEVAKEGAGMMLAETAKEEAGLTPLVEVSKQEEALLMTPVAVVEEMGCPVVGSGSAALVLCSFGRWQWQARWRA